MAEPRGGVADPNNLVSHGAYGNFPGGGPDGTRCWGCTMFIDGSVGPERGRCRLWAMRSGHTEDLNYREVRRESVLKDNGVLLPMLSLLTSIPMINGDTPSCREYAADDKKIAAVKADEKKRLERITKKKTCVED